MTATPSASGLDPDQEYRAAMRDTIAANWAEVWKAMPEAVAGKTPEGVHKVRVASRRLRAAMDVATDCFPRKWYRPLHKTAKAITKSLGEVRDRDVLIEALSKEREQASDEEQPGIDYLISRIKRDRRKARKAMLRFVDELDSEGVRKETKRRFSNPKGSKRDQKGRKPAARQIANNGWHQEDLPPGSDVPPLHLALPPLDPKASLESNARRVLAVRVDDLFSYAPIIPDANAIEALHDARIAAKRLRYTLEIFSPVYGDEGAHATEQMKGLQEELGQVHDHDVRIALIEDELATLEVHAGDDAAAVRPGLEALVKRERNARAAHHADVVKRWRCFEHEGVQARLTEISHQHA